MSAEQYLIFPHYLGNTLLCPMNDKDFCSDWWEHRLFTAFCDLCKLLLLGGSLPSLSISSQAKDLLDTTWGSLACSLCNDLYSPVFAPENASQPGPPLISSFVSSTQDDGRAPLGSHSRHSSMETPPWQEATAWRAHHMCVSLLPGTTVLPFLIANVLETVVSYRELFSSFILLDP